MKLLTKYERKTIIDFFFSRTNMYALIGKLFSVALLTELAALTLPPELTPDYAQWIIDYGRVLTYIGAFFIGKYFGGYWYLSLLIKLVVLWLCFHYNYRLQIVGKDYIFIKNFVFGINNKVNNKVTNNKDDAD